MIEKVTIGEVAVQIAAYRDQKLTHAHLVEWARQAMMAPEIPPSQVEVVMDILQDISKSTAISLNAALVTYQKLLTQYDFGGTSSYFQN